MRETLIACVGVIVGGIWMAFLLMPDRPHDDTDPPGGRSDLRPLADFKTGCQYLMAERGGLTPRLDAAGRHMGCKP